MEATRLKYVLEDEVHPQEERSYLGMSGIGQCALKLYRDLVYGRRTPGTQACLLFHEGYLHEYDVVERLGQAGVEVQNVGREVVAPFDERFKGHIDGEVEGDLLEIKSVNEDGFESVRWRGALPRHRDQVQCYMRYGGYRRALVVYKARLSGELWVCEEVRDEGEGERLEERARRILAAVDGRKAPECECGRCDGHRKESQ